MDDEEFIREKDIPMTKEEIRAISLYKLELNKNDIVVDVGCGTGAMSVDIAKRVKKVYAIDVNKKAIELTKKNIEKFNIKNCEVIHGNAKEILKNLNFNKAFIGGTKNIEEILKILVQNDTKIIVTNTIILENTLKILSFLENFYDCSAVLVNISYSKKITPGHMFLCRNPITIIKAKK